MYTGLIAIKQFVVDCSAVLERNEVASLTLSDVNVGKSHSYIVSYCRLQF